MSNTLEQYLAAAITRGQIDHALRAHRAPCGKVTFYVRPLNGDGETLDFVVRGNAMVLNVTNDSDVPSAADALLATRVPILDLITELCYAIEKCGASPELTDAVTKASALREPITKLVQQAIDLGVAGGFLSVDSSHDSDCSTNNAGVPELLGPCDCSIALGRSSSNELDPIALSYCAGSVAGALSELSRRTNAHGATSALEALVKTLASKATDLLEGPVQAKPL